MHLWGKRLFYLTALICLVFIAGTVLAWLTGFRLQDHDPDHWVLKTLTFFTALLPTLGAALGAIHVQGDFKTVAEQSERTAKRLKAIDEILAKEPAVLSRVADRFEKVSDIMMADLLEWQTVFRTRPLSLPG